MGITTGHGPKATADEVSEGIDLTGKRALITGGASGIGVETARSLARRGAQVTLAVRGHSAAARTVSPLGPPAPPGTAPRWRHRRWRYQPGPYA